MEKWKTKNRFPTLPRGASDDDHGSGVEPKTEERKSAATRPPHSSVSGLTGSPDFMLILRLENA
ncbi:MAG TPA: hypothetical protein VKV17_04980, partial [Bryobacteraceae bacterium]|nr:hypothetical protein [Bryobacteraceae bacterium]